MSFVAGSVTRLTGRREYVLVGLTAAFPVADTCQTSYQTCLPYIKNRKVIYDRILRAGRFGC